MKKNRILFNFFPHGEYFPGKSKGKNPHGEGHNFPQGFIFPAGILTFTAKYFLSVYSKLYRIYLTVSKLYKANHFKPLSQLKLLGEFAKIWFGKNFPVAVLNDLKMWIVVRCMQTY